MNKNRINDAVRRAYEEAGFDWPPTAEGPVALDRLIQGFEIYHEEVSELTRTRALEYLMSSGLSGVDLAPDATPLAGFLVAMDVAAAVFVCRDDNLPRRRFSAAHELGHYLLHFQPSTEACVWDDTIGTITEPSPDDDWEELAEMEREANHFAAVLLMPDSKVRRFCQDHRQRYQASEAFLIHHLASELLVSREAARWRLRELNLI